MRNSEKESATLVINDQPEIEEVPSWALVGKVLQQRVLHVNTIADALRPASGNPKGLSFNSVGENLFVANIEGQRDRDQFFDGGPWMVGKHVVVIEIFDFRSRPSDCWGAGRTGGARLRGTREQISLQMSHMILSKR